MQRLLVAVAAIGLGAAALPPADKPDTGWREMLPENELTPLVQQVTAALQKPVGDLAGGKLDEDDRARALKKARGLALLLEAGALSTDDKEKGPQKRGAVHDAARRLDRALRESKYTDAQAIVAGLAGQKGSAKAVLVPGPLSDARDREEATGAIMAQFRKRAAGGLGVEPPPLARDDDGLENMLRQGCFNGAGGMEPDDLARFAYRLAILGEAVGSLPPGPMGGKDPAKWLQFAGTMRDQSVELANAAKKMDRTAALRAAKRINHSCNECHRMFRDN